MQSQGVQRPTTDIKLRILALNGSFSYPYPKQLTAKEYINDTWMHSVTLTFIKNFKPQGVEEKRKRKRKKLNHYSLTHLLCIPSHTFLWSEIEKIEELQTQGKKADACSFSTSVKLSWVQFSCSVVSNSLRPHESQHARPPCPSPIPRLHSNSRPLSRWCHPAITSSVVLFFSCPQSLPASESFPHRIQEKYLEIPGILRGRIGKWDPTLFGEEGKEGAGI